MRTLDKTLCRHAFDDAVVAIARLAAFSTSRSLKAIGHGEYYTISADLCKKDLLIAAISVRKLSEITSTSSTLKNNSVRFLENKTQQKLASSISVWDLIGNIIHGVELEIIKNIGMFMFASTDPLRAMNSTDEIDAAVIIKSDKFDRRAFKLNDLISHVNTYIEEANDEMAKHRIFLGSGYE
ncbi:MULTISPECIES: hypothetical protein [Alphaproteobacteria]|uniref:Uncharacterized protein n=2 Tax=Alphaproteobacteria TaxID=28211 RepID=A0A512HMU7_9HYPH|nr:MULTISPECIES: hypothetical protein [Alphaproteobacteria]GEO86759.1 hypothetical protein RNA01_36910 [Ciceribacter naphthalenivorans]